MCPAFLQPLTSFIRDMLQFYSQIRNWYYSLVSLQVMGVVPLVRLDLFQMYSQDGCAKPIECIEIVFPPTAVLWRVRIPC